MFTAVRIFKDHRTFYDNFAKKNKSIFNTVSSITTIIISIMIIIIKTAFLCRLIIMKAYLPFVSVKQKLHTA